MKKILIVALIALAFGCKKTEVREPDRCYCFVNSINANHVYSICVFFKNGEFTQLDPDRIREGQNLALLDDTLNIKFYTLDNSGRSIVDSYCGYVGCGDTIVDGGIGIINIIRSDR